MDTEINSLLKCQVSLAQNNVNCQKEWFRGRNWYGANTVYTTFKSAHWKNCLLFHCSTPPSLYKLISTRYKNKKKSPNIGNNENCQEGLNTIQSISTRLVPTLHTTHSGKSKEFAFIPFLLSQSLQKWISTCYKMSPNVGNNDNCQERLNAKVGTRLVPILYTPHWNWQIQRIAFYSIWLVNDITVYC